MKEINIQREFGAEPLLQSEVFSASAQGASGAMNTSFRAKGSPAEPRRTPWAPPGRPATSCHRSTDADEVVKERQTTG